jgi:hypothetical protein
VIKPVVEIRSLELLEKAIQQSYESVEHPLYWRGHANADWVLQPHVFRGNLRPHESNLLWGFVTQGSPRIEKPPSMTDLIGWIHLAQHYELPTRLLDWTKSPLIALCFAVSAPEHDRYDGLHLVAQSTGTQPSAARFERRRPSDGSRSESCH